MGDPLLTRQQRELKKKNKTPKTDRIWGQSHLLAVSGWHSWHVRGKSARPSLLSAAPPVSSTSFSGLRSPSCGEIFRWAERRNIHQPGFLFPPTPPSLASQGQPLIAFGSSGLWCRTSSLQECWVFSNVRFAVWRQFRPPINYFCLRQCRNELWENDSAAVSQAEGHAQLTARYTPFALWHRHCPLVVENGPCTQ